MAPNSWVTIKGTNLAGTQRQWTGDDLSGGKLPTSLDGVSVSINGKAAARNGDKVTTCNDPADLPVGSIIAVGTVSIGG